MRFCLLVLVLVVLCFMGTANAQSSGSYCDSTQDGLCADVVYDRFSPLEQAAASANQATFDLLDAAGCDQGPSATCSAGSFAVYQSVRELVHSANSLSGSLDTEFSYEISQEQLGFAMRWTAAEEMAVAGSMTTEFAANQLATLASRLAALRWGVTSLRTVENRSNDGNSILVANRGGPPRGGGASADDESVARRWGWFVDGAFGYGNKEDTTFDNGFEDAFDFDGQGITVGTDYRFSPSFVAGALVSSTDQNVDFDSSLSIVDGKVESGGFGGQVYAMYEWEHGYASGSLGYESVSFDVIRRIVYPSFNINVPSTDSTAVSSPDSSAILASLGFGYQFNWGAFAVEPYLDTAYVDATIDSFVEKSFPTGEPQASQNDAAALKVGKQSIESLNSALGLRFQYVFTPSFGVLIPYLRTAYHRQLLDDKRRISSRYEKAIADLVSDSATNFAISTDAPDKDFYTVSGGFSVVLKGGLQGFVQYTDVLDLDTYSQSVIGGGVRFEF